MLNYALKPPGKYSRSCPQSNTRWHWLYSTCVIGNNHDGKVHGDYLLAAIVVSVPYLPEAKKSNPT